ncbi:MAG: late competence development ComFB family protein [Candidatus Sericytochromatia bacterium]|nr:late competence development ComFB family protein [Candidatus Sericytochromatia bacterium]
MTRRAINVIEDLTWNALHELLPRIPDACRCDQCILDIYTLALNKLQPHYVTGKRAFQEILKVKKVEYHTRMVAAITASVEKIRRNPRAECQRLGFWVNSSQKVATEYSGQRASAPEPAPLSPALTSASSLPVAPMSFTPTPGLPRPVAQAPAVAVTTSVPPSGLPASLEMVQASAVPTFAARPGTTAAKYAQYGPTRRRV